MKAKTRQCDQLKDDLKELKKTKHSPFMNNQAARALPAVSNTKETLSDNLHKNDQISSKDEITRVRNDSPTPFQAVPESPQKASYVRALKSRNSSLQQVHDSNDNPSDSQGGGKFQTIIRKSTFKDLDGSRLKSPPNTNKKSLFRAFIEEQEGKQAVVSVNDNSLSSLIFADVEAIDEPAIGRYDRMIEKLALKNNFMAILNNLLTSKRNFTKMLMQMTEASAAEMFGTLRSLYVEIIELLKGAQRVRSIFDAAPMIATSMSIEEAIQAIVNYVCESLRCERATVFSLDKVNNQLWSKVAIGNFTLLR